MLLAAAACLSSGALVRRPLQSSSAQQWLWFACLRCPLGFFIMLLPPQVGWRGGPFSHIIFEMAVACMLDPSST
jgi:hypothetical protein